MTTIHTNNYVLVANTITEPVPVGKYKYHEDLGVVKSKNCEISMDNMEVIGHTPLNNAPRLEGVPLLPELPKQEDDVEQLAESALTADGLFDVESQKQHDRDKYYWMKGYKAAASQKRYSEEDLAKMGALYADFHWGTREDDNKEQWDDEKDNFMGGMRYVQHHLQLKPVEWEFVPEWEDEFDMPDEGGTYPGVPSQVPKTIPVPDWEWGILAGQWKQKS